MRRAALILACLLAATALGQSYPLPGAKGAPPVLCAGCPGTNDFQQPNDGLPAVPYEPPLSHVGRYVHSPFTANFQHAGNGIRTIRAREIRAYPTAAGAAPPRLLILMGNAIGAYDLRTFFTAKLPAGMVSAGELSARRSGSAVERFLPWDGVVYPEFADSRWYFTGADEQDPIGKGGPFDMDDRGYLYAGYPTLGWGIAKDDGRRDAGQFPKISQMVSGGPAQDQTRFPNTRNDPTGVPAHSVASVKVGATYYAVIAGAVGEAAIWDTTDPAAPRLVVIRDGPNYGMRKWDRSDSLQRLAWIDGRKLLRIADYSAVVGNGAFAASFTGTDGGFIDLSFDAAGNLWATESSQLWRISPAGVATQWLPFGAFRSIRSLAVGGGHLAVIGTDRGTNKYDIRLLRLEPAGPKLVDVGGFVRHYYGGGAAGFAEPSGSYTLPADLQLVPWGGKLYLFLSWLGLGDVYQIATGTVPKVDPPKVDPPKVDPPKVDPPKVDPPVIDPPKPPVTPVDCSKCVCACVPKP